MARAKQSEKKKKAEKVEAGTVDLSQETGLTLYHDVLHSKITNRLPVMIPFLDYIFGGGLPFGRLIEVIGKNASGKSTLAVFISKIAQMMGIDTAWIDVEGTTEPARLEELGLVLDKDLAAEMGYGLLYMLEPEKDKDGNLKEDMTVEFVADKLQEIVPIFAKTGKPIVIIWDSVAQTSTASAIEKGVGNKQPGIKAKAMAQFSQIIAPLMANSQVLFVAINQARDEMGSMFGGIDSPGGHALHHWATFRLEIQKATALKAKEITAFGSIEDQYIGHVMRVKTLKSKVNRPQQKAEPYLLADFGIDFHENLYRSSLNSKQYNLISGGAWKKYVALDGQEYKFNTDSAWVNFLKSEEGYPVTKELFGRQMAISFPNGFSPYDNEDVDIRKIPLYKDIENYREVYGIRPPEDVPPVDAPPAQDVTELLKNVGDK